MNHLCISLLSQNIRPDLAQIAWQSEAWGGDQSLQLVAIGGSAQVLSALSSHNLAIINALRKRPLLPFGDALK